MDSQHKKIYDLNVQRCRERNIIIPTFKQLANPELIPAAITDKLVDVGLWDVNPLNLFRISWKNEQKKVGGKYGGVNHIIIPEALSGVKAKIVGMVGKFFPTGAHKVGATFGPLVRSIVDGTFDPTHNKALWPSTGNYCRGGAYNSALMGVPAIAVLPEEMSQERFDWLNEIGAEVIATPGCESNVKEIFDKFKELIADPNVIGYNQFAIFENPLFHYHVTGRAMMEVFKGLKNEKTRLTGAFFTQGSAGTLGAGNYLRTQQPTIKIGAGEALQCPTLLYNGFGGHRIEGIGDKHVPWVMDVKNCDVIAAIDDELCMRMVRLFNEPVGHAFLKSKGVPQDFLDQINLMGISGIANVLGTIKMAKYFEWTEDDVAFTVCTDSMEMYQSRLKELEKDKGKYTEIMAAMDFEALQSLTVDHLCEMTYIEKKRMHNLKYFTWIEQQGESMDELNLQWYSEEYWAKIWGMADELDEKIIQFNKDVGIKL